MLKNITNKDRNYVSGGACTCVSRAGITPGFETIDFDACYKVCCAEAPKNEPTVFIYRDMTYVAGVYRNGLCGTEGFFSTTAQMAALLSKLRPK